MIKWTTMIIICILFWRFWLQYKSQTHGVFFVLTVNSLLVLALSLLKWVILPLIFTYMYIKYCSYWMCLQGIRKWQIFRSHPSLLAITGITSDAWFSHAANLPFCSIFPLFSETKNSCDWSLFSGMRYGNSN